MVYSSSLNSVVVRFSEVFREPVRSNSAAMAVVHNHPSGDPTPSPEDVRVTAVRALHCHRPPGMVQTQAAYQPVCGYCPAAGVPVWSAS